MLRIISQRTVDIIREKLITPQLIKLPITNDSIDIVYEWFENEEITLANAMADGESIDETYLNNVCAALDELFDDEDSYIDLNDLNNKLLQK